ncbi:MAG: hypothetical protein IJU40_07655 [Desulfovibrionaceae bacterium]|nr:hypothetical protein [Desulfovibrionaceae bacterium]
MLILSFLLLVLLLMIQGLAISCEIPSPQFFKFLVNPLSLLTPKFVASWAKGRVIRPRLSQIFSTLKASNLNLKAKTKDPENLSQVAEIVARTYKASQPKLSSFKAKLSCGFP